MHRLLEFLFFGVYSFSILLTIMFFGGTREFSLIAISVSWSLSLITGTLHSMVSGQSLSDILKAIILLSLIAITYIGISVLNTDLLFVQYDGFSQIQETTSLSWLPTSIDINSNQYQISFQLLNWLTVISALLSSCMLFKNKRYILYSLWMANAILLISAIWFIFLAKTNSFRIWNLLEVDKATFSGAFIYHAMGNAMYIIGIGIAGMLMFRYINKPEKTPKDITLAIINFLSMSIILLAVICSKGTGGKIFAVAEYIALLIMPALKFFDIKKVLLFTITTFGLTFILSSYIVFKHADTENVDMSNALSSRECVWSASTDMFITGGNYKLLKNEESARIGHLLFGRGICSYPILARAYFFNLPAALNSDYKDLKKGYSMPEYPHSSIHYILFEFGIAGMSFVILCMGMFFVYILKRASKANYEIASLLLCIMVVLVYSFFDIVIESVCISVMMSILCTAVLFYLRKNTTNKDTLIIQKRYSTSTHNLRLRA